MATASFINTTHTTPAGPMTQHVLRLPDPDLVCSTVEILIMFKSRQTKSVAKHYKLRPGENEDRKW